MIMAVLTGMPRRPILVGVMVVGIVAASAGCSDSARTFQLTFPGWNDTLPIDPLPVTLADHTGLVLGFDQAPPNRPDLGGEDGIAALPEDPTALVVAWTGGACDERVSMTLDGNRSDLRLAIETHGANGCRLVGISRTVVINLTEVVRPIDVSVVER